jgi:hypothetical protein
MDYITSTLLGKVPGLILNHLQQQLHLVDIMHKVGLKGFVLLVFLKHFLDYITSTLLGKVPGGIFSGGEIKKVFEEYEKDETLGDVVVNWSDIADKRLGHVVDQGHLCAVRDVDLPPDENSTSPVPFFHLIERLKTTKREGWRRFGINGDVVVNWSDIADKRLGHVVDQGHLCAVRDVDLS